MAHSSIVGGSTAGRLLECPASYSATLALPASANVESVYAREGTAMHLVMQQLMSLRRLKEQQVINENRERTTSKKRHLIRPDLYDAAEDMIDQDFGGVILHKEHLDEMISPALAALEELERKYGGNFYVAGIEETVKFPEIPGAFGTIDLILSNHSDVDDENTVLHVDWKFGSGVGVKAVYRDEHGEKVNPQLLYYATACKHSLRRLYPKSTNMVLAIIQPRSEDAPLSDVQVSHKELKWFREDLDAAVVKALDRDPPRIRGEHCRFAPCKSTCPKWTNAVMDLSVIGAPVPVAADHAEAKAYGEFLARAKVLAEMAAQYKAEIDGQIHAFLEAGGTVPGWRLKFKTKQRKWVDTDKVVKALTKLGFDRDQILTEELVTFKSAEATAKQLGVEIPADLRVAPPSHETTIATTDDPAPVVDRQKTVELFAASLKQLGH